MTVGKSHSAGSLRGHGKKAGRVLAANKKRTCLSAESTLSARHIEELPLGAKLPMIPGNRLVLCTTQLCEKLHRPSCNFDRTYPSDVYVTNEYRCLHDNHLKHYFADRSWMVKRLRKKGFISDNGKVLCSLKEYNLYRQYLKHLSVEFYNKKYVEQYTDELDNKRQMEKENIKNKQKDEDNPITVRIRHASKVREQIDRQRKSLGRKIIRESKKALKKREETKKEEQLKRIIKEEKREARREKKKKLDRIAEEEANEIKEIILREKLKEDLKRKQMFEERKMRESQMKEQKLIEKYERKKEFHMQKLQELEVLLSCEEANRKSRVEAWRKHFTKRWNQQRGTLDKRYTMDRTQRDRMNKVILERIQRKGWTGAPCRGSPWTTLPKVETDKDTVGVEINNKGTGDAKGPQKMMMDHKMIRQLSAMGFHNVLIPSDMLCLEESDEDEEDPHDLAFVDSETIVHSARSVVDHVLDSCVNVLYPMLKAYENKTNTNVDQMQIGSVLKDLCEGVFDEETDNLPDLVHFEPNVGHATIATGRQNSTVRFVVSKSDLPLDFHKQNRPPTPKSSVRFWNDLEEPDIEEISRKVIRKVYSACGIEIPEQFKTQSGIEIDQRHLSPTDSQLILNGTIQMLAGKIVEKVYETCGLTLQKDDVLEERLTTLASSIVDDIILFGINNTSQGESPRTTSASSASLTSESSQESFASLDEKVSILAKKIIQDLIASDEVTDSSSAYNTSCTQTTSTHSALSGLAIKVVTQLLNKVDPESGQTMRDHLLENPDVEGKVKEMCDRIVQEILQEQQRLIEMDKQPLLGSDICYELEEKLSKLALNITTTILKADLSHSQSGSSMNSIELEQRVTGMTEDIVKAIFGLKKLVGDKHKMNIDESLKNKKPEEMKAIDFIQNIFNLEELQKAPKHKFKEESNNVNEIAGALTNMMVPPRNASSVMSSGISEAASALAQKTLNNAMKPLEKASTVNESSINSAVSLLGHTVAQESVMNAQQPVGSSTQSAMSAGISELADQMAKTLLVNSNSSVHKTSGTSTTDKLTSEDSKTNASDLLVDMIVDGILQQLQQQSNTDTMRKLDQEFVEQEVEEIVTKLIKGNKSATEVSQQTKPKVSCSVQIVKDEQDQKMHHPVKPSQSLNIQPRQFLMPTGVRPHKVHPQKPDKKKLGNKMVSTGQLSTPLRTREFKTSFNDFRTIQEIDLSPVSSRPRASRGDIEKQLGTSSEALNDVLDTIATRIVNTSMQENASRTGTPDGDTPTSNLDQLVSSLALGMVSSLLGLDNDNALILPQESGSTTEDSLVPVDVPEPSAAFEHPAKPPPCVKTPKKSCLKPSVPPVTITSENILDILQEDSHTGRRKKWSHDATACVDNALEHPNRIPSPSAKKITKRNKKKKSEKHFTNGPLSPTALTPINHKSSKPKRKLRESLTSPYEKMKPFGVKF